MRTGRIVLCVIVCLGFPWMAGAQTEWVDDPANPVLVPGSPGTWDAWSYINEVVLVDGTYHMFYMGQEEGSPFGRLFDIGHATSPDGSSWTLDPANPVLVRDAGEWDSDSVAFPAVIHDGAEFRMWYLGHDGEIDAVGYATSPDGTTWTKHAGNPVMDRGPAGSFDDGGVWPGTVVFDGEKYRMWYTGERNTDEWIFTIGTAESDDGLSWTRHPEPIIEREVPWSGWLQYAPTVVFDGSVYRMWYAGNSGGGSVSIGHAVSSDGVEWTSYWSNPVISRNVLLDVSSAIFDETIGAYRLWAADAIDEGFYAFTSDCCATVFPSIIPAAAFAAGAEGSFYETDLDLSNASGGDVEYLFSWLPRGESNKDPLQSELFTLGAGQSVRYANVLAEVFDLEPDAFGALRIDAASDDLMALARIANVPQEPGAGSFGQAMAAIRLCDCTGRHEKRRLLFGTEHAEMRFNVGCLNVGNAAARVSFELYASDGTMLDTESLILMPWSNDQLNRIFQPYQPVTGYVDYWSDLSTGSVYCYGSVLDNVTSDPTTVPPM